MSEKKIKPRQYSHIDYEALLIYVMKNGVSVEEALEDHGLNIARSTVIRNITKMKKEEGRDLTVIDFYQKIYVPNSQKSKKPQDVIRQIQDFVERPIIIKNELEDLYNKLSTMNKIVEACNGNVAEATRKINSGETPLGKVKSISVQGLRKDIKYFERVKEEMEKTMKIEGEER